MSRALGLTPSNRIPLTTHFEMRIYDTSDPNQLTSRCVFQCDTFFAA